MTFKSAYPPVLLFILLLISSTLQAKQLDLFILAGQSNMQGWRSDAAGYPKDNQKLDQKIPFYFNALHYSSSNKHWQTLGPQRGHFKQGHFGPEVTFARALKRDHRSPAIFKYSSGGTSIKLDWKDPGQHGLYDAMVQNIQLAIKELKEQGNQVNVRAFIWIQGESDADNDQLANEYYWHLRKLLHHLRSNILHEPELPVILSVDEQHPRVQQHPQVVDAQIKLAFEDPTITFVSMIGLEKSDVTHLTARGTIQQGKRLYSAYKELIR